jgi:biopolymer transport protein ExbD
MAMALGFTNGTTDTIAEMNTTPLIDVLLVLLVMLILTIPLQTHAVKLSMPLGPDSQMAPPPVVQLGIDFDGSATWNGTPVDRRTLNTYFAAEARKPLAAQAEIHLRPNRLAKYGTVAPVLADAQRNGVRKIWFAGNEQYSE